MTDKTRLKKYMLTTNDREHIANKTQIFSDDLDEVNSMMRQMWSGGDNSIHVHERVDHEGLGSGYIEIYSRISTKTYDRLMREINEGYSKKKFLKRDHDYVMKRSQHSTIITEWVTLRFKIEKCKEYRKHR